MKWRGRGQDGSLFGSQNENSENFTRMKINDEVLIELTTFYLEVNVNENHMIMKIKKCLLIQRK